MEIWTIQGLRNTIRRGVGGCTESAQISITKVHAALLELRGGGGMSNIRKQNYVILNGP